jgi:hypothetical protein
MLTADSAFRSLSRIHPTDHVSRRMKGLTFRGWPFRFLALEKRETAIEPDALLDWKHPQFVVHVCRSFTVTLKQRIRRLPQPHAGV